MELSHSVEQVADLAKLIDTIGYAAVVLAVVLFLFLMIIMYIIYQNKNLTNNLIASNQSNIVELRQSIDKLSDNLLKMSKSYEMTLEDITEEVAKLREKYNETTSILSNIIYEEKSLSPHAFETMSKLICTNGVSMAYIQICGIIDANGFDKPKRIELLKEEILHSLERNKLETKGKISDLNFSEDRKKYFCKHEETLYKKYIEEIKKDIVDEICIEDLKNDYNYVRLKTLIRNKMCAYQDNLLELIQKTVK